MPNRDFVISPYAWLYFANVTSVLEAFCTAPYGVCPFLTGLVPALILTVGGHDTQVYKVKM